MATGRSLVSGEKREFICTGCVKKNKTLKAVKYCVQCQVYCCQSCVDMHEWYTPLARHSFLDIIQGNQSDLTCTNDDTMFYQKDEFEEEFSNWAKAVLSLQKARDGSIKYIKSKLVPFLETLDSKHTSSESGHFKDLLIKVTVNGDVNKMHLHKKDGTKIKWRLEKNSCTTCDEIFKEQLDMFIDSWCPCKKWIRNSTKEQVEPTSYWWILAKMYIAQPEIIDASGPAEVEPLAIFNLIKHCKLFDANIRSVADELVQLRHRLMHSANDRVTRKEMENSFDSIKKFLKMITANLTETTDIINEVEMLEKRTVILYDENGQLSELAKEALQQQDKSLNADFKPPEGLCGAVVKSLASSNIAVMQLEMKYDKKIKELTNENEDIQRRLEESEKKVNQYEVKHDIGDEQKGRNIIKVKSINIKVFSDSMDCRSEGICFTPNSELLITDLDNKKLKRIDTTTMSIVDNCNVDSHPGGIFCINRQEVVVACQKPHMIQFFSICDKMKPTRKIKTSHRCYGIAMKDDHLYVTDGTSSLYVYGMNGKLLKTIRNDKDGNKLFSEIRHIAINEKGDKIFVCDFEKGLLTFDGECNYLYNTKDNDLNGEIGVCTDGEGNVLVSGYLSNNIVQFNEYGEKIGVVLKEEDGLNRPYSISFHQGQQKMYVTMGAYNNIKMYEL